MEQPDAASAVVQTHARWTVAGKPNTIVPLQTTPGTSPFLCVTYQSWFWIYHKYKSLGHHGFYLCTVLYSNACNATPVYGTPATECAAEQQN